MESVYKSLAPEQFDELLSNFLISSWSYSKVSTFARHEKAFEMQYIFGLYGRSGPTTVAGTSYHEALKYYFGQLKETVVTDLAELEMAAFAYLDTVPANRWKMGKTTPTIEACMIEATKTTTKLLHNFYAERYVYEDDLAEILDVEVYFDEFLRVNGVDIPLPAHGIIDLVGRTKSDKTAVIDHKSKLSYTDDKEASLVIGPQAITYALAYESKTGRKVDEVWFVENKPSQNKDGGAQLRLIKIELNDNTRRLYEALLYEPLRRMIAAVKDPDYVYLINMADNYVDMAEVLDFWARTQICEVEDFNVDESKKDLVKKRLKKIRDASIETISPAIIKKFKEQAATFIQYDLSVTDMTQEQKIEHVLRSFGVIARCAHKFEGYSSNTYLLEVSAGVKITSVISHKLDIANALDVATVRIPSELVVYEGKAHVAIDFAKKRDRDLLFNPADLVGYKIPIGKDNYGNIIYWDMENHSTTNVLVCGQVGSGKSVCVESTIAYSKLAGIENIIILDPKYEFTNYRGPGIDVLNEIPEIEEAMKMLVDKMNEMVRTGKKSLTLVVFDEFADAVAQSRSGNDLRVYENVLSFSLTGKANAKRAHVDTEKSLEENMRILLQKGRSSGFRVMAATQRASVKVITGDAKVNFPVQICFRVPKIADSVVVLDEAGAEGLAGKGDGLMKSPEFNDTVRFQAYYKPQKQLA